jgi:dipeptidyl aminopeptidase/acylaminoacyl peptidase
VKILVFGTALAFGAAICAAQTQSSAALKPLTAQQAINVRSIGDLHFSPDGSRVAFVVTEAPSGTTRARHIWLLDVATKQVRQLTFSAKSEESPRWSPDGKTLAFTSDREENQQIYLLPLDGGEGIALTKGKRGVQSYSWSPDGKQIAFLGPEPTTDAEEKKTKDKDDARVADKDAKLARLWLIDVASGKERQLTKDRWRVSDAEWMPDGSRLIVEATKTPESDANTNRIYSLSIADSALTELAAPKGPFGQLRVSPDGKTLAYIGSRVDGPSPHDLFELTLSESRTTKNLTGTLLDRPVQQISYSQRSPSRVEMIIHRGFESEFGWIEGTGAVCSARGNSGSANIVVPRSFDRASTGALVYVAGSFTIPDELWLAPPPQGSIGIGMCSADLGTQPEQVTTFNDSWKSYALQSPAFSRYKSFDGLEIEGALLKPANYQAGTRVATIVLVHGGPTGAWSDSIETWGQLLAAHGFAVFYPNIRGSTGYGHKFIEMNRGDWGGGDFKDVMAGVDYLIAQGIADPDKLGIGGWSYGGYMSEWAITQTKRFKAAVSGAGLSNLASEFGTENGPAYDEWFYGTPYENLDGFMKSSPVKYLKNAQTPTLILQGDADTTDPIGQSEELYRGLKHYGVEAEMVIYPREPHGLREEKHLVDRLNRILAWYESHLK